LIANRCSYLPRLHSPRLDLSVRSARLFTRTRHLSLPLHDGNAQAANMSLAQEKHEWGAVRVRQTFLDYFKERGHTFGKYSHLCSDLTYFAAMSPTSSGMKNAN
jgi:hypothetical protein